METMTEIRLNFNEQKDQSVRIEKLKKRAKRCVCKYCGKPLTLRKVTYAAYDEAKIDIHCQNCDRIEYGVEPEVYLLSKYFVEQMRYDHYPYLDETPQKRQMNISVINDIVSWAFQHADLINEEGLTIPLQIDDDTLGEIISTTADELARKSVEESRGQDSNE